MTETQNPALNESISALVDGETNDLDLQRVLKSLENSDDARRRWSRYHAVSAIMKGESVAPDIDLSLSVREAVAKEDIVAHPQRAVSSAKWRGVVGKTAVAASVAVAMVMGLQYYSPTDVTPQVADVSNDNAAPVSGAVVPRGFELPPITAQTVSTGSQQNSQAPRTTEPSLTIIDGSKIISSEEFQRQINRLMFLHAERVSTSGGMGAIPFARVSDLNAVEEGAGSKDSQ